MHVLLLPTINGPTGLEEGNVPLVNLGLNLQRRDIEPSKVRSPLGQSTFRTREFRAKVSDRPKKPFVISWIWAPVETQVAQLRHDEVNEVPEL